MPDAPRPAFNSHGNIQHDWLVVVSYRAERDCYTLSWTRDGDRYHKTQQGAVAYPGEDLHDLVEGLVTQLNVLGAPRLF